MRPIFLVVGLLLVGIAGINLFIPGAPSTVFVIMALYCFKRSSPRMEDWLLNRSVFGPPLRDWESDRSMTRRNKVVAITMLWLGIGSSMVLLAVRHRPIWVIVVMGLCAVGVTVFLSRVRTKDSDPQG